MAEKVTKDMTFQDILSKYPESASIMMKFGLHCIGCHMSAMETIEQGCLGHGMDEKMIDEMLKEINNIASKKK